MKVSELLNIVSIKDYAEIEIWRYTDRSHRLHSDFIESVEDGVEKCMGLDVVDYFLLDEEGYNDTILANSCVSADFADWYGDKETKVLAICIA